LKINEIDSVVMLWSLPLFMQVLQNQLHTLQKPKVEENKDKGPSTSSDSKGKTVASGSSSVSDCGRHGENDEVDT
jgi:hypothetical protein